MLPTTFPEQNKIYGKPETWTDEQCMELPVWEGQAPIDDEGNRSPVVISCWRLSKEDLEEIQRTGDIFFPQSWLNATFSMYQDPAAWQAVETFLQAHPGYHPKLKAQILQATDNLRRTQTILR